jgi:pimeloyl-ACP methyl ester carboxylesterase
MPRFRAFVLIVAMLGCASPGAFAQTTASAVKPPPQPVDVTLKTRDGVDLAATFYGSNVGKEAVPVIMLHQFKGSRADFKDLALALQGKDGRGCAVLVPDLRGHGRSTRQSGPGGDRELNAALLRPADIAAMAEQDLEACKAYLMEKNNAGELNINKLCVVGAEMGAVVGVKWAEWDWHWPALTTGKQGQDVKALILISPVWSYKGLSISDVIANRSLAGGWSWLIIVGGQDSTEAKEAKRLNQSLEKFFPKATGGKEADAQQPLVLVDVPTSLQSAKLLAAKKDAVAAEISKFIERRLTKQGYPWSDRKGPL